MLNVYAVFGVFPFGDRTALVMDLNGQYADFMMYWRRVLLGDDSLFYSFAKEMGGNAYGLSAYYLFSPFNLIMLLFPMKAMPEGIALITMLKIAASGLTFSIFLKRTFNRNGIGTVIFSCAYALATYSMHYSMCIMWLDGVIWLPLVLLGAEQILNGRSPLLMLISYTAAMLSNYYTAYMITIFSAIYFFYRYAVAEGEKNIKDFAAKLFRIFCCALLGALLSAIVLLPSFLDISLGKLAGGSYEAPGFLNVGITTILRRLFIGQYDTITNSGNPNIFCGALCGLTTALYFFNPKIKLRNKIAALCVYAFLTASFFIKKLDMAWHIFQYPAWYPYRYAFVFNFFSAMIAFTGFERLDSIDTQSAAAGACVYIALLSAVIIFGADILTNKPLALLTIIMALVYTAVILLIKRGPERGRQYCIVLALITCAELTVNGYYTINGLNGEYSYKSRREYSDSVSVISDALSFVKDGDDGFYRTEKTISRTDNDSMSFGYNGMTHYSSTYNNNVVSFNKKMGMLQEYVLIRYLGSTILTDSMLGVKYVIADSGINDEYEIQAESGDYTVYKNQYALPIGFAADNTALSEPDYNNNFMENQNKLVSALTGDGAAYKVCDGADGLAEFTAPSDGIYYAEMNKKYDQDIELEVNGKRMAYPYDDSGKIIFCVGKYKRDDSVKILLADKQVTMRIYGVDTNVLKKLCEKKQTDGAYRISKHSNTRIDGEINLADDEILFTTIPYEKGWSAYVDGEKVQTECAQGVFLAVDAGAGEHTVTLRYRTPGFAAAASVSIAAIPLSAVFILLERRRRKK